MWGIPEQHEFKAILGLYSPAALKESSAVVSVQLMLDTLLASPPNIFLEVFLGTLIPIS